ncbi:hypothetical protein [Enterobacter genomosp. S]|nr:hypothetical protein [Enterobacter genomosp. S]
MRPQSELLTLSQMQKCTCGFLHAAFSVTQYYKHKQLRDKHEVKT